MSLEDEFRDSKGCAGSCRMCLQMYWQLWWQSMFRMCSNVFKECVRRMCSEKVLNLLVWITLCDCSVLWLFSRNDRLEIRRRNCDRVLSRRMSCEWTVLSMIWQRDKRTKVKRSSMWTTWQVVLVLQIEQEACDFGLWFDSWSGAHELDSFEIVTILWLLKIPLNLELFPVI